MKKTIRPKLERRSSVKDFFKRLSQRKSVRISLPRTAISEALMQALNSDDPKRILMLYEDIPDDFDGLKECEPHANTNTIKLTLIALFTKKIALSLVDWRQVDSKINEIIPNYRTLKDKHNRGLLHYLCIYFSKEFYSYAYRVVVPELDKSYFMPWDHLFLSQAPGVLEYLTTTPTSENIFLPEKDKHLKNSWQFDRSHKPATTSLIFTILKQSESIMPALKYLQWSERNLSYVQSLAIAKTSLQVYAVILHECFMLQRRPITLFLENFKRRFPADAGEVVQIFLHDIETVLEDLERIGKLDYSYCGYALETLIEICVYIRDHISVEELKQYPFIYMKILSLIGFLFAERHLKILFQDLDMLTKMLVGFSTLLSTITQKNQNREFASWIMQGVINKLTINLNKNVAFSLVFQKQVLPKCYVTLFQGLLGDKVKDPSYASPFDDGDVLSSLEALFSFSQAISKTSLNTLINEHLRNLEDVFKAVKCGLILTEEILERFIPDLDFKIFNIVGLLLKISKDQSLQKKYFLTWLGDKFVLHQPLKMNSTLESETAELDDDHLLEKLITAMQTAPLNPFRTHNHDLPFLVLAALCYGHEEGGFLLREFLEGRRGFATILSKEAKMQRIIIFLENFLTLHIDAIENPDNNFASQLLKLLFPLLCPSKNLSAETHINSQENSNLKMLKLQMEIQENNAESFHQALQNFKELKKYYAQLVEGKQISSSPLNSDLYHTLKTKLEMIFQPLQVAHYYHYLLQEIASLQTLFFRENQAGHFFATSKQEKENEALYPSPSPSP